MANLRQLLQLASLYIGYGLSVFVRKSFTFVLPDVIDSTGIERSQLGELRHLKTRENVFHWFILLFTFLLVLLHDV